MKKLLVLIMCTSAIIFSLFLGGCNLQEESNYNDGLIDNLSEKLIRFHVLANSNSSEDQELKQKVKDRVVEYLLPKLQEAASVEESREILLREDASIKALAEEFIKNSGYEYAVSTELSRENFPVKRYGAIELPQGEYEAYRIIIGSGSGENWWCVMFPPLCFVDVTMGEIEEEKTSKTMEEYLSPEEYEAIKIDLASQDIKEGEVTYRFKLLDVIKDIFK